MEKTPILGRTGIVTIAMGMLLLGALWMCLRASGEAPTKMFGDASLALVLLATGMAGKSTLESIATGNGLKGIGRSLMTDAKPGTGDTTKVTEVVEQTVEHTP